MEDILLVTTDRTILVFLPDPASTDGSGKTGLTSADLTVSYTRVEVDNDVVVTDVTSSLSTLSALTDAHADWGVKEVSSTLAPGLYRLDVADAVFAAGAWYAVVYVMITTSAAAATPKAFRLVALNALDGVRAGLTALPNAAADAAGGLVVSDAGGLDADVQRADVTAIKAKTDLLPAVTAGAVNGLPILGGLGEVNASVELLRGDAASADNLLAFFDGTGYAGTNNVIPTVTTVTNTVNAAVVDKTGFRLDAVGSATLTESYAADGVAATLPQLLYLILAALTEMSIVGTTMTLKKLDGTTAATCTLNHATQPTSVTRSG